MAARVFEVVDSRWLSVYVSLREREDLGKASSGTSVSPKRIVFCDEGTEAVDVASSAANKRSVIASERARSRSRSTRSASRSRWRSAANMAKSAWGSNASASGSEGADGLAEGVARDGTDETCAARCEDAARDGTDETCAAECEDARPSEGAGEDVELGAKGDGGTRERKVAVCAVRSLSSTPSPRARSAFKV